MRFGNKDAEICVPSTILHLQAVGRYSSLDGNRSRPSLCVSMLTNGCREIDKDWKAQERRTSIIKHIVVNGNCICVPTYFSEWSATKAVGFTNETTSVSGSDRRHWGIYQGVVNTANAFSV